MSINLKYRPRKLKQFCGNKETVNSLREYLKGIKSGEKERRSILITGQSGCGKTTLGRLVGTEVGAYDCKDKMNVDFQELNASDFKGVDTIRAIRKQMAYAPKKGKYSVFFMDEAHKLTPDAQEAFLKPLEEPPAHVIFILATTNPEKLKVTLKRRCATFQVNPLSDEDLMDLMQEIVGAEKKKVPESVLEAIIESSACSPGVALGILDTVIDLPKKEMKAKVALFKDEQTQVIDLCRLIVKGAPWGNIAKVLSKLKEQNEDPEGVRRMVMGYCASILLKGDNPHMFIVMESFREPTYNNGFNDLVASAYEALGEVKE